jgi:hypothetical protein
LARRRIRGQLETKVTRLCLPLDVARRIQQIVPTSDLPTASPRALKKV